MLKHSFFTNLSDPIELKFHVKTPYDKLAKIYTKYFGHMTKMMTTPIYGKNHLKIFPRTRKPGTCYVALGCEAYQVCNQAV